ncbi:hypothetical protein OWR29_19955 [Actinoplanes sp. Pm04-4]|uniref:Uncharacterized protein n=1 Tax=Paractinoplanes pyxinae TaxID=2997416 RepID=A0ABT4B3Q2_9ACTN|nr:hypothetical protein [Actinoplanes pyxinae]MCY1140280.1 hypothetical protein [Actinoplanes pyxinae]
MQDRLLAEFRAFPSVLTVYLSAQMYDAIGDLISNGQMAPNNLFERFVAWARKATVVPKDAEEDDLVSAFREQ